LDGPNNRPVLTDQYAVVAQGKAEKEWPFSACSDSKFTDREYDRYKTQLQQDNVRPPPLSLLQEKCTGIHNLLNRKWTDEDINARLSRAKAVQSSQSERDRLQKDRATAAAALDESAIAKIDAQLQAIEARLPAQKPQAPKVMSQQEKLAARNAANRIKNTEEVRAAQIADRRRERTNAEAVARGGKSTDRHARVRTVAKTYFDAAESKAKDESDMDDLFGDSAAASARASPAPKEKEVKRDVGQVKVKSGLGVGGMKKRKQDEDFMEAMDLGIEIDI
jgi:RNA polymerase-associated protein RTF1